MKFQGFRLVREGNDWRPFAGSHQCLYYYELVFGDGNGVEVTIEFDQWGAVYRARKSNGQDSGA